ncbi:hypothetical protein [Leifsonia sp. Leaf264]|uniref:hypothetical protein n=1 Tax=Leifsonia sp. Leaf264 TaxID=1736314 RepID=UPI0006F3DDB4|nr:hypothetical protein [Leifsonia sp. Leaf264]KQO98405.1 hypothetical protein ASF30_10110 [Leifsonia sp. Leaf264]
MPDIEYFTVAVADGDESSLAHIPTEELTPVERIGEAIKTLEFLLDFTDPGPWSIAEMDAAKSLVEDEDELDDEVDEDNDDREIFVENTYDLVSGDNNLVTDGGIHPEFGTVGSLDFTHGILLATLQRTAPVLLEIMKAAATDLKNHRHDVGSHIHTAALELADTILDGTPIWDTDLVYDCRIEIIEP